jgi:hypothetical protein
MVLTAQVCQQIHNAIKIIPAILIDRGQEAVAA